MRPSRHIIRRIILLLPFGILLFYSWLWASGGYSINWYTVDGGGATFLSGGSYSLGSTAGQSDAAAVSGGSYTLQGGFWPGAAATATPTLPPTATPTSTPTATPTQPATGEHPVFLPFVVRGVS